MNEKLRGDPALAREIARSSAVLSVTALNRSVRDLLEHQFPLVWVGGEISNLTQARSGHLYFSLKDEQAQVRCVMYRSRSSLLDWQPRDGMKVEVRALITLYEPRGEFQLTVEFLRREGLGALYEAFVRLRDRLQREGLFDPSAKRALPAFPRAIGVVTSPAAAALHDVLTTLARRNPAIPVIIYRTSVQGDSAPTEIIAALRAAARRAECDVLVLCRGGGSIEDLWAFNDERLARAIRASPIPIVVGVGHDTDVTIADFAADVRAPTPTAAAELVSPARDELLQRIDRLLGRLHRCARHTIEHRIQLVDHVTRRLVHPGRKVAAQAALVAHYRGQLGQLIARALERRRWVLRSLGERARRHRPPLDRFALNVGGLAGRLNSAVDHAFTRQKLRIDALEARLAALDPRAVLERGYSIVRDEEGRVVRAANSLAHGELVEITFARGNARARVEKAGST
jgi:exodeoxyribonuclease VII large subunit